MNAKQIEKCRKRLQPGMQYLVTKGNGTFRKGDVIRWFEYVGVTGIELVGHGVVEFDDPVPRDPMRGLEIEELPEDYFWRPAVKARIEELEARISELEAQNKAMREALEPLAKIGRHLKGRIPSDAGIWSESCNFREPVKLLLSDAVKADEVLAATGKETK